MPDLWTHYFFAKEVMIENHLKDLDTSIYYFAAQGPDFLFYLDFYPWKKKDKEVDYSDLGSILHIEKTNEVLQLVFSMLENQNQALRSYLYGFLTHYALDSRVHPFVFFHAKDETQHKRLEMTIDVAMYKQRRSKKITKEDALTIFDVGRELPKEIIGFYQHLALALFGREIPAEILDRAYNDMKNFHRLTRANTLSKKLFLKTFNSFSKVPIDHYIYENEVDQRVLTQEMFEEFKENYDLAKVFFAKILEERHTHNTLNFEGRFVD